MGAIRHLPWESHPSLDDLEVQVSRPLGRSDLPPGPTLVSARESDPRPATPEAWATLIDRIQRAGKQARDVDAQAKEQEQRVQEILERVREDIRSAEARVKAADQRAEDAQARAAQQVRTAEERARASEERAKAAEERAQTAEGWLGRIHQTIVSEFNAA